MRQSSIFAIALLAFLSLLSSPEAYPRNKRFAFGIIGIGGGVPSYMTKGLFPNSCVVTNNIFFANGIRMKELTEREMKEFEKYKVELEEFKAKRRAYEIYLAAVYKNKNSNSDIQAQVPPELPDRPSFCQPEAVKQTFLDGCIVQNKQIYIGSEYARDLTEDELEQLAVYDKKQQDYEKELQRIILENYRNMENVGPFFEDTNILEEFENDSNEATTSVTVSKQKPHVGKTLTLPTPPERPQFCTMII